ncbi:hypothetical protein B0H13DRAFT_1916239 [Mycena leptocephala]|nr:hypothetical protein B0H13DRAFT_1916239 [Mycena leptocephala]
MFSSPQDEIKKGADGPNLDELRIKEVGWFRFIRRGEAGQPADRGQYFRKPRGWISNEDLRNEKRERRWMRGYWVCETKAKEWSRSSSRERVGWRSRTTPEAEVLESELYQIEIGIDTRERCADGGGEASDALDRWWGYTCRGEGVRLGASGVGGVGRYLGKDTEARKRAMGDG